jgi:hypothetical protein
MCVNGMRWVFVSRMQLAATPSLALLKHELGGVTQQAIYELYLNAVVR